MLTTTKVNRSLDQKTVIFFLEVIDLFTLVAFCSILNLIFGQMGHKFLLVYFPTLILGAIFVIGKRGKPERFLFHFLRYQVQPKFLSCFKEAPLGFSIITNHKVQSGGINLCK